MTNGSVTVDNKDVIKALANLSHKKMNTAYKKAMKMSVQPIEKQAKANLRKSGIKNVSKKYVSKKTGKTYNSMLSGIKTSIFVQGTDDDYAKVHIMGEFRLKWFEMGTSLRKTDKGWNRGSIRPKWFFRDAVMQKGKVAIDTLDENIRASIQKAWNKK